MILPIIERKTKRMCENLVNHGAIAFSGFIFQALYAIIVSMKDDKWNALKVEPLSSKDKTDIALYESVDIRLLNDKMPKCYKKIQVKKRTPLVTNKSVEKWCEDLKKDDEAYNYELCLFGNVKDEISDDVVGNVRVYSNNLDEVIKTVKKEIAGFFENKDVADYSSEDLDAAYYALFHTVCINSQEQQAITRDRLCVLLKDVLKRSPYNRAAVIKQKSMNDFYENEAYTRDLKTPRLDKSGTQVVYENLSKEDYPDLEKVTFEQSRYNLFDYLSKHVKDRSTNRHIFISGTSGSGKTTYLYGVWRECLSINYYVPIYVPLYQVSGSIKKYIVEQYFSHASIKRFDWIKGDGFNKTPYHIILLLDGYNELADNSKRVNKRFIKEINDFISSDKLTVIITSRNPDLKLNKEITRFKMCQLSDNQITRFLGENNEFLEATWYKGLLDNPFMLEKCIVTFSDDNGGINSVAEASMGMILKKYFDKQMGRDNPYITSIEISVINRILIDIILPITAMILDKKDNDKEICKDEKKLEWVKFNDAVNLACSRIDEYQNNIKYSIYRDEGYKKHVNKIKKIKEDDSLADTILKIGCELEIFNDWSKCGLEVIWDHEIYRDYFVARGYALYSANHKDAEANLYNLGMQINYRYPEPGLKNTRVSPTIRQYHVRKAQMFIDMVDAKQSDFREFKVDGFTGLKNTAVYRRLIRDVALIYEDMKDIKMFSAADLGLEYYTGNLSTYNHLSDYDINYDDIERRYADAAYSISSLAYNYTHDRIVIKGKENEHKEESKKYLRKAFDNLQIADSIFKGLKDETKEIMTVRDDVLKRRGNLAAYYIGMYKIADTESEKEKFIKAAKELHEKNKRERIKIKDTILSEGGDTRQIQNEIASSYNGIATCLYYMGKYEEAINVHREAIDERPEDNSAGKCMSYRNMIGCYAKMKDYSLQVTEQIFMLINETLDLVYIKNIYTDYGNLKKNILKIIDLLKADQSPSNRESIREINKKLENISGKSFN